MITIMGQEMSTKEVLEGREGSLLLHPPALMTPRPVAEDSRHREGQDPAMMTGVPMCSRTLR